MSAGLSDEGPGSRPLSRSQSHRAPGRARTVYTSPRAALSRPLSASISEGPLSLARSDTSRHLTGGPPFGFTLPSAAPRMSPTPPLSRISTINESSSTSFEHQDSLQSKYYGLQSPPLSALGRPFSATPRWLEQHEQQHPPVSQSMSDPLPYQETFERLQVNTPSDIYTPMSADAAFFGLDHSGRGSNTPFGQQLDSLGQHYPQYYQHQQQQQQHQSEVHDYRQGQFDREQHDAQQAEEAARASAAEFTNPLDSTSFPDQQAHLPFYSEQSTSAPIGIQRDQLNEEDEGEDLSMWDQHMAQAYRPSRNLDYSQQAPYRDLSSSHHPSMASSLDPAFDYHRPPQADYGQSPYAAIAEHQQQHNLAANQNQCLPSFDSQHVGMYQQQQPSHYC